MGLHCWPALSGAVGAAMVLFRGGGGVSGDPIVRQLSRPDAECAVAFDSIADVRPLSGGRALVLDPARGAVTMVACASPRRHPAAAPTHAISKLLQPSRLFAVGRDSTLVINDGARQWLLVGPAFTIERIISMIARPNRRLAGVFRPRGVDGQGRLYVESVSGVHGAPDGSLVPDSLTVLRYDPRTGTQVTVARLAPPSSLLVEKIKGDIQLRTVRQQSEAADSWAVGRDGALAIVRVGDYHVEWIDSSGSVTIGPSLAEKRPSPAPARKRAGAVTAPEVQNAFASAAAGNTTMSRPAPAPAFVARELRVANDGRLWVLRTRETVNARPTYDIIDRRGRLAERVVLPQHTRIVGFDTNVIYVAKADGLGREHLQRYRVEESG